jgi:hypothetical protein
MQISKKSVLTVGLLCAIPLSGTWAASTIDLGTSGNYAILAKAGVTNVPTSTVTGDIGVSPIAATAITGFDLVANVDPKYPDKIVFSTSTQVVGKVYAADYKGSTPSNLTTAVLNMQAAYTDAAGRPTPDSLNLNSGAIGGLTLVPGLYKWGSDVTMTDDVTLSGGSSDIWIFQISGNLFMSAAKRINLNGGVLAKNVFWQVAGQTTINAGAHFEGIILSKTAINFLTGASMNGRALAQTAVVLEKNTITQPAP